MGSLISYYMHSPLSLQDLTDYSNSNNYPYYYVSNDKNDKNDKNVINANMYLRSNYITSDYITTDYIKSVVKSAYAYYIKNYTKYYVLYIHLDSTIPENIKSLYLNSAINQNKLVNEYLNAIKDNKTDMSQYCLNAGFDLYNVEDSKPDYYKVNMLDHKITCCMKLDSKYVSYYLYSRSSTPLKTPLRLSNNVGIIDSGYRGTIKALFDINLLIDEFKFKQGDRYVQICPPNIEYPMKVFIVDSMEDLGNDTLRGSGGFGSTG